MTAATAAQAPLPASAAHRITIAQRWRHLPREGRDAIFLLAVLAWTLLPHVRHLPAWCIALTTFVLVWRAWLAWRSRPLPSSTVRLAVVLLAVGLTWWTYRSLFGKDPGVTLLVMLSVLKALELRARRDALVMFFLGFFIVITNFFFGQGILVALAMVLSVWGLLTALVLSHMPSGRPTIARAGAIAARCALLGAPIMVALFVLFPRIGPLWGSAGETEAKTGLSGSLLMGGVIELISDERIAFRIRFDGAAPRPQELYFRGPVLTRFDGREWFRARPSFGRDIAGDIVRELRGDDATSDASDAAGDATRLIGEPRIAYRYEMLLEPMNLPLLPLLEGTLDTPPTRPTAPQDSADRLSSLRPQLRGDLQWVTERPVAERVALRAAAVANLRQGPFQVEPGLDEYLTLPDGFNPRTRAWARALLQTQPALREQDAPAVIGAVLRHINEGFVYTLTPGTYGDESGRHAIDEFWLDRRQGFCEHYATAMVVILRTLGVPARIVTGYQGADPEPQDGWTIVRQANAHAWLEAWAPDQGWFRVDPTAAVAPERVREGRTLRPARGFVAGALATIDPSLLPSLRRLAERIEHRWNRWVVQYSRGQQYELLRQLGVSQPDWGHLAYALLVILCTASIGGAAWAWWDRNRRDPWERLQARVRERLRKLGIVVGVHEAPRALAARVRDELGARGETLAQALLELDRQRYAERSRPHPDPAWWRRFAGAAGAVRNA